MKVESFLEEVVRDPHVHARFVNTLSLLEYMGARKILKSQTSERISCEVLAHASEEIRHAQMLKRLALKLSNGALSSYSEDHLLCGAAAKRYFQAIDRAGAELLKRPASRACYLLTTWLVEERAIQVYPCYERCLDRMRYPHSFRGLILEEEAHLTEVRTRLKVETELDDEERARLKLFEHEQFCELMGHWEREVFRSGCRGESVL